ncbi:RagB/SusD family nutrient uptake outer membrane protein, partial [Arcticibacter sp.]|uniref:RagB/SusD family nutrient uptake outer membrane protein n=1 Tax=Arcticibacter sp. TaxID=1872630 RepID=UPI003890482D
MNFKSKLILALTAVVFMLSACDKYLDLRPEDGVVRQEFWKTKEQVDAAVNGCYAAMLNPKVTENLFLWGELRGDMVVLGNKTSADDIQVINVNTNANNKITDWSSIYQVINYCNDVIDSAPLALESDKTFTREALNEYLGQALAIRSLMYFYLARSFGDVPLKLKATHSDADNLQIPKSSQQEVLTQIVNDLKTAEQYVVSSYANKDLNKGKITKYAVQAMLADVYLWMDNYQDCITYCDKVITSGQYTLVPGDDTWFNTLYYQGGSVESIFELYFNANRTNSFYEMFSSSNNRIRSSPKLYEVFFLADPLEFLNRDIRGSGGSFQISLNSIWKYHGVNASSSRGSSNSTSYAHWFFYRYADILLMKAEALNQSGKGAEALDL